MKAVIPAAGLGTRFLPLTKEQPKEMLPVVDRPAIHWVVEEAVAAGATDILIITGREKRAIEDCLDRQCDFGGTSPRQVEPRLSRTTMAPRRSAIRCMAGPPPTEL